MSDFPVEHLSASSLTRFMRCPRQWQDYYVYGNKGAGSSATVLGNAVHLGMSRVLKGEDPGSFWLDTYKEHEDADYSRMAPHVCAEWAVKLLYHYYETIGKHLNVLDTEIEIAIEVPGVDIPVIGFIDFETDDRNVDLKTTGYFSPKQVRLNPEWRFQQHVYQLHNSKPSEIHVLTRSKTEPVLVPNSTQHMLYIHPPAPEGTQRQIKQVYDMIRYCWENYGDGPWPGNPIHEWSGKYCNLKGQGCCQD